MDEREKFFEFIHACGVCCLYHCEPEVSKIGEKKHKRTVTCEVKNFEEKHSSIISKRYISIARNADMLTRFDV